MSRWFAAALAGGLALSACAREPYVPRPGAKLVVVPIGAPRPETAGSVVWAEVAATPDDRARGLSGRERLPKDGGMLFVYTKDEIRGFWMKDCLIPLDIAFIDAGERIAALATLPPGAGIPDATQPRASSRVKVRYVLETAAGWLAAHGIGVGDEVDLAPALAGVAAEAAPDRASERR